MKIDDNYRLENDSNQWTLIYEKEGEVNPKTVKPTISTNKWYCGNMKQALKRYLDESLKECNSIETVLLELKRVESVIDNLK